MNFKSLFACAIFALSGCMQQPHVQATLPQTNQVSDSVGVAELSYGAIKKHLEVGKSTIADVVKLLGSPNNMTMTSAGNEIWIYDRISTQSATAGSSSSIGGGIGVGATSGNVGGIAGIGGSSSSSQTSLVSATKTLTVILEFKDEVLIDLLAREGRY